MLYLSRGEQAVLVVLIVLLLGGAGVLTYRRGVEAGQTRTAAPIFVEAPPMVRTAPALPPAEAPARVRATADDTRPTRSGQISRPSPAGPISLNTATLEQLDSLPGIGPVYAQRILDYRQQLRRETGHGFTSVDELLNVSGIGPKRLSKLRDQVIP